MDSQQIEVVSVDAIKPLGFNPASRVTEPALKGLRESIAQHGILQPLALTPNGDLIDGERRWRCAKALGLTHVPVMRYNGELMTLYRELNGERRRHSAAEWLNVWVHGGDVPEGVLKDIRRLCKLVGAEELAKLAQDGVSPRGIMQIASIVCGYCGDKSDGFKASVIRWARTHKQTFAVRRAIADKVSPETIIGAIKDNRPIHPVWVAA